MPEICLIPPVGECINVAEARLDRRIDYTDDDAKLRLLISAARQAAEMRTKLQLLHARYKLVLNAFPGSDCWNSSLSTRGAVPSSAIVLPRSPLVDIIAIQYIDMAGTMQTVSPADYVVNAALTPAIITPAFGKVWPIAMPQIASVFVTYDVGFASPVTFPVSGAQFSVTGPVTWLPGAQVQFYNSGGALPVALNPEAIYTIDSTPSAGQYTLLDATGAAVAFADAGTGRGYIGIVPEGIRSWMLLRLGSIFENREEVAILARGKIEALPYVDGLLDPYISDIY
ncbi:phage head-tail connector protein [Rugamonas sp.]|uniref:phage head-tail connector protein n=1 Tax=Rugamonas sp. TaxID=1926287 RepID=UPI0025F41B74|nr:phage head-tail connector protein [Rugamonas sp.]